MLATWAAQLSSSLAGNLARMNAYLKKYDTDYDGFLSGGELTRCLREAKSSLSEADIKMAADAVCGAAGQVALTENQRPLHCCGPC